MAKIRVTVWSEGLDPVNEPSLNVHNATEHSYVKE